MDRGDKINIFYSKKTRVTNEFSEEYGGRVVVRRSLLNKNTKWVYHDGEKCPYEVALVKQASGAEGFVPIFDVNFSNREIFMIMPVGWTDNYNYNVIHGGVEEREVQSMVNQIVRAIRGLKVVGVSHNNIKNENIIRRFGEYRLIDLSLATNFDTVRHYENWDVVGTVACNPPELFLDKPYFCHESLMMWQLGVAAYEMATGEQPFDVEMLYNGKSVAVDKEKLAGFSKKFKCFLARCFDCNSDSRMSIVEALEDPFLKGYTPSLRSPSRSNGDTSSDEFDFRSASAESSKHQGIPPSPRSPGAGSYSSYVPSEYPPSQGYPPSPRSPINSEGSEPADQSRLDYSAASFGQKSGIKIGVSFSLKNSDENMPAQSYNNEVSQESSNKISSTQYPRNSEEAIPTQACNNEIEIIGGTSAQLRLAKRSLKIIIGMCSFQWRHYFNTYNYGDMTESVKAFHDGVVKDYLHRLTISDFEQFQRFAKLEIHKSILPN